MMIFNQNVIKYWLPVILWMLFIFGMSTETFSLRNTSFLVKHNQLFILFGVSSHEAALLHVFIRKTWHVTEYFILGLLIFRALRGGSTAAWDWRWFWEALMVVVLWAAIDEFHQSFVPTRTASYMDVGIDTAGGILAQFMSGLWLRNRK